jgi:hypothetical protein
MTAKALLPSQCQILHQYYPPNECCLCKAELRVKELEEEVSRLQEVIKVLEESLLIHGGANEENTR